MNQDILRMHLIDIVKFGMKLNAIAEKANVDEGDLSSFKNGHKYLKKENAEKLKALLDQIVIPK